MLKQNLDLIKTILKSDTSVTKEQKETIIGILNGNASGVRPALMDMNKAARYLSVSRQTLFNLRRNGIINDVKIPSPGGKSKATFDRVKVTELDRVIELYSSSKEQGYVGANGMKPEIKGEDNDRN